MAATSMGKRQYPNKHTDCERHIINGEDGAHMNAAKPALSSCGHTVGFDSAYRAVLTSAMLQHLRQLGQVMRCTWKKPMLPPSRTTLTVSTMAPNDTMANTVCRHSSRVNPSGPSQHEVQLLQSAHMGCGS